MHTLNYEKDRLEILGKLEGLSGNERSEVAIRSCEALMQENWAERRKNLGNEDALKERVLSSFAIQKQVIESYLGKYKRIAVVAHSECIKKYAGYKIKNCEIFAMPF